MTKLFRGCRYQLVVHTPNEGLWSRHASLTEARKSFREAVNNRKGYHVVGTLVELLDVSDGDRLVLHQGVAQP